MSLRPGKCYTRPHRPYTRQSQKVPRKGYVKGVPKHIISQFEMGKKGEYDSILFLVSKENIQIRHNALESSRVAAVQTMEKNLGKESSFFMKIRVFPHHVIRENAMATGAGADRYQQGMRMNFGNPIGTAAIVKEGQRLIELRVSKNNINLAKKALKKASYKLPTTCRIEVMQNFKA